MKPPEELKMDVKIRFNAMSETYDQIHFLRSIPLRLVEMADLKPGQHILDLATGTGAAAMAAAERVGLSGHVTGVDLSPQMLAHAREKVKAAGLSQISFQEGDAEHLIFPNHEFDAVLCSLGLFFMPDMLGALEEWRRVLKPGGMVGFASFGGELFHQLLELWRDRLARYNLEPAAAPVARLNNPAECSELLVDAGFPSVEVSTEQMGYYFSSEEDRIRDIVSGLEGEPLKQISPELADRIIREHREELRKIRTSKGIFASVPAIFSFGYL